MRFIYADSLDVVDPGYDFIADRHSAGRSPYWDDVYPHQILGRAPYKGMLVSRAIVGGHAVSGKYSEAQAMRFRRGGARSFLRLDIPGLDHLPIFGDCGAFSYHREDVPPYSPEDTAAFYEDGGFTHGCSVDHIIFEHDDSMPGLDGGSQESRRRFDITLANAEAFLAATRSMRNHFTPLGVIQGWSPASMADAARQLVAMGYDYLAVGGTVPLKTAQVRACVAAIHDAIPRHIRLHVLGFARADEIESFTGFGITSFDTASPMIRSFKDANKNYYLPDPSGGLSYYTAIRVPQALENNKLMALVKQGALGQEELVRLERAALTHLRAYDRDEAGLDETIDAVMAYAVPATLGAPRERLPGSNSVRSLEQRYRRTLGDRPWRRCPCNICQALSIEVMIFRASNRNKRRGIHNMSVFDGLVDSLELESTDHDYPALSGCSRAPEHTPPGAVVCGAGE
ncbi:tRNA-guanine transglycosylase DpdA [Sphingomonas koreensis]|uniref:tRNA-guanine(15) transglycosylase-like domain-containing protein n=1 Tax=Sphingomonas koreensis TaxID=93064 RepID=A0A1L6J8B6_9SPHN|nr:tRNA-guanine transglycosylase DpdA [Sphingomonas koreensis]APR52139.1 hypothetical protein BRX40_06555 [Sphingomonas koreensis]